MRSSIQRSDSTIGQHYGIVDLVRIEDRLQEPTEGFLSSRTRPGEGLSMGGICFAAIRGNIMPEEALDIAYSITTANVTVCA